jgi:glycine/D-amino acid oxidase-like deaminating enzyme
MNFVATSDYIVIGGGIAGLSLAQQLRSKGVSVICFESVQPGFGCSNASLGLVYPISPLTAPLDICDISRDIWAEYRTELDRIVGPVEAAQILISRPLLEISTQSRAEETVSAYRSIDYHPIYVDDLRDCDLGPLSHQGLTRCGLLHPIAYHLDVERYCRDLLAVFLDMGGQWICPASVDEILIEGDLCVGVKVGASRFRAHHVVMCTGANLALDPRIPVTPVRGQMILLNMEESVPMFVYTEHLDIVHRGKGELLIGSTVELDQDEIACTFSQRDFLLRTLHAEFDGAAACRLIEARSGIRAKTPDSRPLIGETRVRGLSLFTGFYRNGIVFSPAMARFFASDMLGQPHESNCLARFSPLRFD